MRSENVHKTRLYCCQIATNFIPFIRNHSRWTRWWRQFSDRKQN